MNPFDTALDKILLKMTSATAAEEAYPYGFLEALTAANTLMAISADRSLASDLSSITDESSVDASSFECAPDESSISSVSDSSAFTGAEDAHVQYSPSTRFNLYDPADEGRINGYQNIFRRDIYEGFIVGPGHKFDGTVAFRCRFCAHLPYEARAKQCEIYPRSIDAIYRAHIRFNRDHFPNCKFIPDEIKAKIAKLKKSSPRGNKAYWVTSALNKGLVNGQKGIVLCREAKY